MEVTSEQLRHCDNVMVKGRVDASTAADFGQVLSAIIEAGRYNIVVNLRDVTFMSSAGLGELIDAQKRCKQLSRGEVVLAECSDRIKEVLRLAGLTPMFRVFDSGTEAVGSF